MLRIGITGGIGSGKSMVCKYFESRHVPVYYADDEAAILIDADPGIRKKIIAYFGEEAYNKKGLNKIFMRQKVFNDAEALANLNAITHPPVLKHFDDWCVKMKKQGHPFVIKEAALVFESDSYKSLDLVACVVAPAETRIARVMHRDDKTKEEVENIIKKQMTDEEKIKRSDFVIRNNDDELLLPQIVALHEFILKKSASHGT
jgi:dephospho-CoA kinase